MATAKEEAMESIGQVPKKRPDIIEIKPNSSPADIELNERWSRTPTEELSKLIIDGFLYSLTRQPILPEYEDLQEKQVFWWLRVLRRFFAAKQNELVYNNWDDFKLCLRCLYLCSLFGENNSKFHLPKVNKKFWEEIMEDWHAYSPENKWGQEVLTFFLKRYALAGPEEAKTMEDVFRHRLDGARAKNVEFWARWIRDSGLLVTWTGIGRYLAIARASDGGWNLLLEDIQGGELIEKLCVKDIRADLLPIYRSACARISNINEVAKTLADELALFLSLDFSAGERVGCHIGSLDFVKISVFCSRTAGRDDYPEIAEAIQQWMIEKVYLVGDQRAFLSSYPVSLVLEIYDMTGSQKAKKRWIRKID
jgi:hypothetical protein